MVKLLMNRNADVNLRNYEGHRPSDVAQNDEIRQMLLPQISDADLEALMGGADAEDEAAEEEEEDDDDDE